VIDYQWLRPSETKTVGACGGTEVGSKMIVVGQAGDTYDPSIRHPFIFGRGLRSAAARTARIPPVRISDGL